MIRFVVLILLLICVSRAWADDIADKCQALRDLNADYRGRSLTISEKAIKLQMIAWYRANCQAKRSERAKVKSR